jgi:cytochrome c peroxidase
MDRGRSGNFAPALGRAARTLVAALLACGALAAAPAAPLRDAAAALPLGSQLDEAAIDNPREVFHSEASRGRKSYQSKLGNLAFNSPYLLGATARRAGISCASCHVNGATNPKLFIPGLSTRPGNFDTTSALFNAKTDDGVLDPLTIPSLRGARFLSPYGHDGRMESLREFVRNVIVNEFAGPEPSAQLLDAIVFYIDDIDFLPNPALDAAGHLSPGATPEQRRGEALFTRPFPHDPSLSCAACHVPSAAFVDHRQHDVGSGGLYKTPTLVNANFNAPYFHDGRFDSYAQVIEYFDRKFALDLSAAERGDLAAYLTAIGDGVHPEYRLTGANVLADLNDFASVLDLAIANHDREVIGFAVRSLPEQLADLAAHYPSGATPEGASECALARATVTALAKTLQRLGQDAAAGRFGAAAGDYANYRRLAAAAAPKALQAADPYSLFNPERHAAGKGAVAATSAVNVPAR